MFPCIGRRVCPFAGFTERSVSVFEVFGAGGSKPHTRFSSPSTPIFSGAPRLGGETTSDLFSEKNEPPRTYEYYEYCAGGIFNRCTIQAGCVSQRFVRRPATGPKGMPSAHGVFAALGIVLVCASSTPENHRLRSPVLPVLQVLRGNRNLHFTKKGAILLPSSNKGGSPR